MNRVTGKVVLWTLLAVPAALSIYRFATDPGIWPGDLLHPTGEWSARFIIIALMLTPLAQLFPRNRAIKWLVRYRRAFGVAAFAYAVLHLIFYVLDMETVAAMLAEIGAPGIWTGWLALMCLVPLALTSNDAAMRALRRNWKRVQRLAYPAAILTLIHWLLIHDGKISALVHFAPLILLQALRLARLFHRPPHRKEDCMTLRILTIAAALSIGVAASPAAATGKMTCDAPQAQWKTISALEADLIKQGWQVRKSKVDGGCYEVYGTDPEGNRVEAYFHPVSFKKLLVSRRGEVLFRAK